MRLVPSSRRSTSMRPSAFRPSDSGVLEQKADVVDVLERSAEVVGDGVGKCLELLVGDGELGGAFCDALLEFSARSLKGAIACLDLFEHLVE